MKLTMSSLLMVASFMLLCTIMTVQAQTSPLLNSSLSHYAVTVFELRAQGTCNLTCQEISPLHCDIGQRYTIFRASSGEHTIVIVLLWSYIIKTAVADCSLIIM